MKKKIAIDLFSGCGGLSLGLKLAGFRVIGAVDNDTVACETYKMNHPEVKLWEADIRRLDGGSAMRHLRISRGNLDLLAGCPPCQGFARIRTLNGKRKVNDSRNDLIFEFLRFVSDMQPKSVMMENVPGLARDLRFRVFVEKMNSLGYSFRYAILDAANYAVPQRRRRLIFLAGRHGAPSFTAPRPFYRTVRDTIGWLPDPGISGDAIHDLPEKRSNRVLKIIGKIPKDGGSRSFLGKEYQLQCHKRCSGFNDIYGRMKWKDVAPTITGGCINPSKGRFLHPEQDRAVTLREAALLQSFPPNYRFSLRKGKYAVAALIGNALPPEFIKRIARGIFLYLNKENNKKRSQNEIYAKGPSFDIPRANT